jgi:protoheme IX farnesyltransferase
MTTTEPRAQLDAQLVDRDGLPADRSATGSVARSATLGRVAAYVALTKPRIIELLLVTTLPVMFLAAKGLPDLWLVVATLVGGTLAAGSANALNCYFDRDIDERMRRTRRRPLPAHTVSPRSAVVFGAVLGVVATAWLGFTVNWLSALLALGANVFYVVVYTLWLKRRTWQNTVWGGIAGCFPTLIGWTAVTDRLAWAPVVLFGVVFLWTPPHTWALAMRYREDYAAAGVPMLPVVADDTTVVRQIVAYTWAAVACSFLLWPVGDTGLIYPVIAAVAGVGILVPAHQLRARVQRGMTGAMLRPMQLFHGTNLYLTVLFVAVAVDALVHV